MSLAYEPASEPLCMFCKVGAPSSEFFIDNQLDCVHCITGMILRAGLVPGGGLNSLFLTALCLPFQYLFSILRSLVTNTPTALWDLGFDTKNKAEPPCVISSSVRLSWGSREPKGPKDPLPRQCMGPNAVSRRWLRSGQGWLLLSREVFLPGTPASPTGVPRL